MQRLFSVTGPILVLSTAMQPPHASPEVNRSGMLTDRWHLENMHQLVHEDYTVARQSLFQ